MKLIIDIDSRHDYEGKTYPNVGQKYVQTGAVITVRDVRGRVAWRGTIDGYKSDGRASRPMKSLPDGVAGAPRA